MDINVGIGEMYVTNSVNDRLATYSLGSCLGLTIYDPVARVSGMIHAQLPSSKFNGSRINRNPAAFVDIGIPLLFEKAYKLGAKKERIILKMAGCTNSGDDDKIFKIGERNYIMARKLLWKNNVFITAEEIGGNVSRTIYLDTATGVVTLKAAGITKEL